MRATEHNYRTAWQSRFEQLNPPTPWALAVAGGQCAIDLANVFIAGYQAAIRATFSVAFTGWVSYAASEDRSEINPLPGLSVTRSPDQGYVLNGCKTWIAAIDHVDELVVKGGGATPGYFRVARGTPGLTLAPNPKAPSMLPTLSQGRALFSNVLLDESAKLAPGQIKQFATLEALYIETAFCAWVASTHEREPDGVRKSEAAASIARANSLLTTSAGLSPVTEAGGALSAFDQEVQQLRISLSDTVWSSDADWMRDQSLIKMYSRALQPAKSDG